MIPLPDLEPRRVPVTCGIAVELAGADVDEWEACEVDLLRFGPALVCPVHGTIDDTPVEPRGKLLEGAIACSPSGCEVLG